MIANPTRNPFQMLAIAKSLTLSLMLSVGLLFVHVSAAGVDLIRDAQPSAVIVLPAEPAADEQRAADELVEHIGLISGAKPKIIAGGNLPEGLLPLFLGAAADPALDEWSREAGVNPSSFTLRVTGDRIDIRGLSAEGTLFGVYELLEQLGVRWYIPGDLGRVIPQNDNIRIAVQRVSQAPSMDWRHFQAMAETDWIRRQRMGGEHRSTGAHGLPGLPARGASGTRLFEEHPELFSLVDGERRARQHCISNPESLRRVVAALRERLANAPDQKYIGMGPRDGRGYCECPDCRAMDGGVIDPFYGQESMTDRYILFFNRVLAELEDDYPDLHLVWYVYGLHMMPPEAVKPNPRIVGVFAPISMDRIRGMDNPMSTDRHTFRWLIDAWAELEPNEMYYRGYYNNLACPQFPKTQLDRVRNEIPAIREKGINVMRVEVIRQSWASDPISLYVAARMMWDIDTDVDALLTEFYEKYYGPAAEPMQAYHETLESAFADTPYCTGSSYVYFPIFDAQRRNTLRGYLDGAAALAPRADAGLYGERVWAIRQGFDRLELFLNMTAARNRHDFETAYSLMHQYFELNDALTEYELEVDPDNSNWIRLGRDHRLVNRRERSDLRGNYFNRFFQHPVDSGYERTVRVGELVATLADAWDFLIDPAEIGEIAGYYRPGELGGNWQPLRTTSLSWSDQGLHYYKGVAWYRQKVTIPAEFEGRPVYLWFGGVDNAAKAWVNGELLGTNREPLHGLPGVRGTFRPFDFLATSAVRFGEPNTVSVKITNDSLAELGTGGIVAPVMFWSPHDPDWKP